MKDKPRVVVTGGSANALGVLRSLTHCELTLLCDNKEAPAWHSRWGRKVKVTDTRSEHIVADLLALVDLQPRGSPPVLILTEEKTVVQVSLARDRLSPHYRFLLCTEQLLFELQSKAGFQRIAQATRSPVPNGLVLHSALDLANNSELRYPCVLKPLEQDAAYSALFRKAYKVGSPEEVSVLYSEIEKVMPNMILQEWLEGEDSDIYFCLGFWDERSQLVGKTFTGRKLRSWPRNVGGTASCTGAPEAAETLTRLTDDFVKATGYVGQMGMEFKFDTVRGGFYMVEPTVGRTDYQHEIATLSGCNLLAMMVAHLNRNSIPDSTRPREVIWYDHLADTLALESGAPDLLYPGREKVAAIWRAQDPMPTLANITRRVVRRLAKSPS